MAADQDVYFDSDVSVFKITAGGGSRTMTPYIKELRGLPGQYKVNDITAFGAVGEQPGLGLIVAHFSIEWLFNQVDVGGTYTILYSLWNAKIAAAFEYYPAGETVGNAKISGNAKLVVFEVTNRVGDYVAIHSEFYADNGVTCGLAT